MPFFDLKCKECGWMDERMVKHHQPLPACPDCGNPTEKSLARNAPAMMKDKINGGLLLENGLETPVRVFSHSEKRKVWKENGCRPIVYHQGLRGSDRSPFTTNWNVGMPAGIETRPFAFLTPEEQIARHKEWLNGEPECQTLSTTSIISPSKDDIHLLTKKE